MTRDQLRRGLRIHTVRVSIVASTHRYPKVQCRRRTKDALGANRASPQGRPTYHKAYHTITVDQNDSVNWPFLRIILLRFWELQEPQAGTTLSAVWVPPRLIGTTWSCVLPGSPQ
jgi:hypothetical protein